MRSRWFPRLALCSVAATATTATIAVLSLTAPVVAHADADAPAAAVAASRLPVREVTVFKDGHAFVLHEGQATVGAGGSLVLDQLPTPVLGTFWPFCADRGVTLRTVTASHDTVADRRPAASLRELLSSNIGARLRVRDPRDNRVYEAVLQAMQGDLALLRTEDGLQPTEISRLSDVTLLGEGARTDVAEEQGRDRLTLKLDGVTAGRTANVGLMYLQKGIRWIPSYRIVLDGEGRAQVTLQATVLNELADMDGVTLHLVVGTPRFAFQDTPDPMALQETFPALSRYFTPADRTGLALNNAIATQGMAAAPILSGGGFGGRADSGGTGGGEAPEAEGKEDLFLFSLREVRLRKGERMVVPLAQFPLRYRDVYSLELPPLPPRELREGYGGYQVNPQIAALLTSPRVEHRIRFENDSPYPMTTAPALLLAGERVLAQGTMTYTPRGAEGEVALTGAVNIEVKRTERESKRTPGATVINDNKYTEVELAGSLRLTNRGSKPAVLEVQRYVLGAVTNASAPGVIDALDPFGESALPFWWSAYQWPGDLGRVNALGRAFWKITLEPNKSADLTYEWRYLWR